MHYVYLIQHELTKDIRFGCTDNISTTLIEHNAQEARSRKRKSGMWKLIYAEAYASKDDAMLREQRLKQHGSGKQELLKRLEKSLNKI